MGNGLVGRLLYGSIAAIFLISGCTKVGPDYVPPKPSVPDQWSKKVTKGLATGNADLRNWWKTLKDPTLDGLIKQATKGNLDLKVAFARIKETRARLGIATGDRFPDLNASGFLERSRESKGTTPTISRPVERVDTFYGTGLDASWEIDFWGRIARSIESADADLSASFENYRDALVLLFAEIAQSYVDVRTLQKRIQLARKNVDTQRGSLGLAKARFEAQLAPELDIQQAELNLANTEQLIPRLQSQLARAIHRLSVLLGKHPSTLYPKLSKPKDIPPPPKTVLVGVPRDVVRQRPDIRAAERALAAQNALVGVATAALYPQFTLSGTFAYETASSGLFDRDNEVWAIGPSFRWNIFDGGRVRNNIRLEEASTARVLVSYEQTVLNALEEVENAMVGYSRERERSQVLRRAVTASENSVKLVKVLYTSGLTDFQNVFDSERTLAEQDDSLAQSEGEAIQQLISIYRALGGGWQPEPKKLTKEVKDAKTKGEPIF